MAKAKQSPRIPKSADAIFRPDFKRPEYVELQELRTLCDALWDGTRAIRKLGELALKKWPAEKTKHWEIRRDITQVTRYYRRIVEAVVGMICAVAVALEDAAHPTLKLYADDVDGQGTALGPFAKTIMTDAVNGGFVGIFVDYPPIPEGTRLRLDQEDALGLRPFMVRIPAERIPSWIIEYPDWKALIAAYLAGEIDGDTAQAYAKQVIVRQVVFHEPAEVFSANAFGASTVDRFRVVRLTDAGVTFTVWTHVKPKDGNPEYFEVTDEGRMMAARKPLREIPLAVVYAGRKTAPFVAEPALLSVAELNLDHHNISSDRRYLMRLCHAPTLFLAGFDDDVDAEGNKKPVEVGPNSLLKSSNADAKAEYVAADPAALDSSQVEKREVVQQIQAIGMAFVGVDRKTSETATGRMLDDAAENANIATVSEGGKDGIGQAWRFMAMHVKGAAAPGVKMQTSYASPRVDPQIATVLWNAVAADKLDVESWLEYIKTGELPEDLAKRVEFLRVQQAKDADPSDEDDLDDDATVDAGKAAA